MPPTSSVAHQYVVRTPPPSPQPPSPQQSPSHRNLRRRLRSSSPKDGSSRPPRDPSARKISLGIECDGSDMSPISPTSPTTDNADSDDDDGGSDSSSSTSSSSSLSSKISSDTRYNQSVSRRLRLLSRTTPPDEDETFLTPNCKLFEFMAGSWSLVGSGDLRLLKHREEGITGGQTRIVMRNALVSASLVVSGKGPSPLLLNFVPDLTTAVKSGFGCSRTAVFTAQDYSTNTGDGRMRTLAVRAPSVEASAMMRGEIEAVKTANDRLRSGRDSDDAEVTSGEVSKLFSNVVVGRAAEVKLPASVKKAARKRVEE